MWASSGGRAGAWPRPRRCGRVRTRAGGTARVGERHARAHGRDASEPEHTRPRPRTGQTDQPRPQTGNLIHTWWTERARAGGAPPLLGRWSTPIQAERGYVDQRPPPARGLSETLLSWCRFRQMSGPRAFRTVTDETRSLNDEATAADHGSDDLGPIAPGRFHTSSVFSASGTTSTSLPGSTASSTESAACSRHSSTTSGCSLSVTQTSWSRSARARTNARWAPGS